MTFSLLKEEVFIHCVRMALTSHEFRYPGGRYGYANLLEGRDTTKNN